MRTVNHRLKVICLMLVVLSSCTLIKTTQRTGAIQTIFPMGPTFTNEARLHSIEASLEKLRAEDGPAPIPGHLLVKIDPAEISRTYRPLPSRDLGIEKIIPDLGLLSDQIPLEKVEEVGVTRKGKNAVRLYFARPMKTAELTKALSATPFTPVKDLAPSRKTELISNILVELEQSLIRPPISPLVGNKLRYPQLKEDSKLSTIFGQLQVRSIRRVFRAVEKQTKKGDLEIVKMTRLLKAAKKRYPQRTARAYPDITVPRNMENWFLLRLSPDEDLDHAISLLKQMPGIQMVTPDYPIVVHTPPNDPEYATQWGLKNDGSSGGLAGFDINAESAWSDPTMQSESVVIAVLDTGFKEDLEDELLSRLWTNLNETPDDNIDDDNNGYIDDIHGIDTFEYSPDTVSKPYGVHGTQVAGIIAAKTNNDKAIAGTAGEYDVSLMNLSMGECSITGAFLSGSAEVAEALSYATLNGADIVNMSFGGRRPSPLVEEQILTAHSAGLILVASAGNEGVRFTQGPKLSYAQYPALYDGVIAVGGVERNGQKWPSSNWGAGLDLVAPAASIKTIYFTDPASTTSETTEISGTSASAAFVSGAAAIILGKHTDTEAPYMRHWLRAKAHDITDPLGDGSNLIGEDEYTGAGMLNAGNAVAMVNQDQPIDVDILVEKLYIPVFPNAVAGSPDLGITVKGSSLSNWWLEYGEGDSPQTWTSLAGSMPSEVMTQEIDVPRNDTGYGHIDVETGHNYLNTDGLANKQIYTLRLTAENQRGTQFVAYDWFVPLRAWIGDPKPNTTMVKRWDWPRVDGVRENRSGGRYQVAYTNVFGAVLTETDWVNIENTNGGPSIYSILVAPDGQFSSRPQFPTSLQNLSIWNEAWGRFVLLAEYPPSGGSDTVDVYFDSSDFSMRQGWPIDIPVRGVQGFSFQPSRLRGIKAVDVTGTGEHRIFVQTFGHFMCLNPDGTLLWDKTLAIEQDVYEEQERDAPGFLVDDLDGDGIKEILVTGGEFNQDSQAQEIVVYLLRPDGTSYNLNWPMRFPCDPEKGWQLFGKVHAGDVAGDLNKEIIFHERGTYTEGLPSEEQWTGRLHVVDLDAQPLPGWPLILPRTAALPMQIGDIDADGKDEILIEPAQVLEGDGSTMDGWPACALGGYHGGSRLVNLDGDPQLEVLNYEIGYDQQNAEKRYAAHVLEHDGTDASGWPVLLDPPVDRDPGGPYYEYSKIFGKVGQVIPGGDPEVVLCYDKIHVLDAAGQSVITIPPIDLNGQCNGIELMDLNGDDFLEFVVLVNRKNISIQPNIRRGTFLEAYQSDGTPINTDNRWPINVSGGPVDSLLGQCISIEDVDGDGTLEAIHVIPGFPYRQTGLFVTRPGRIEVLDIR